MIFLMYMSSTFLALATYYSESKLCGLFFSLAFVCSLIASNLWDETRRKIKSLEKALERSEGK